MDSDKPGIVAREKSALSFVPTRRSITGVNLGLKNFYRKNLILPASNKLM